MRDVAALQSDEGLTNTLVAQADQLIAQAQFEANSGHTARARELAQQALDVARESGDPLRIGHALYTAGASQFNTSSPDVPLQILFAARDCLLALEPDEAAKTLLAPTYCFIGYFYARMGLAREATEAISESFARARLLSDIVVRFKTLLTGAFAFSKQSDFDAALAGFAEAAALAQQTKNPMHLAMVESGILRTEVARLREREFIDDDPGVAEEAQKWLQRAQGVVDVDPALAGDAVVLELRLHLYELRFLAGQAELVTPVIDQDILKSRELSLHETTAELAMTASACLLSIGEVEPARLRLQQALEAATQIAHAPLIGKALRSMADVLHAAGRSAEAMDFVHRYDVVRERALRDRRRLSSKIFELQSQAATLVSETDQLRRSNAKLDEQAHRDSLTSIANRRALEMALDGFCNAARGKAALALIDVDYLKRINDAYGHAVGDIALVAVADVMRQHARLGDMPGRLGGDEFLMIFAGVGLSEALMRAEAIRQDIAKLVIPGAFEMGLSASIGVAALMRGEDRSKWVRRADAALYEVKREGRNSVGPRA